MLKKMILWCLAAVVAAPLFAADANQQYTVQVYMADITCLKVVEFPGDTMEDLYGSVYVSAVRYPADTIGDKSYPAVSSTGSSLWGVAASARVELGAGQSRSYSNFITLTPTPITHDQVLGLEFDINGNIYDWEAIKSVHYKPCDQCGSGYRTMRLSSWASQIEAIPRGGSKVLEIGGDNTFQLDWYEGDSNSSHVRARMKIKVLRN